MVGKEPVVKECDVFVAGGGIGGCMAAIRAKEAGAEKVIQIDKGMVGHSGCSGFGASNLVAVNPDEQDVDAIFKEAVELADYFVDQERLEGHIQESWPCVLDMAKWGVEFERNPDGSLQRLMGRGMGGCVLPHGSQMMEALGRVPGKMGVEQIHKVMLTDLLTWDGRVVGALAYDFVNGQFYIFKAKATVLATGSCRYKGLEPCDRNVTGDGQAAAYRAGADVTSLDMVGRNGFANRWDTYGGNYTGSALGGVWRNAKGEDFIAEYYDRKYKGKTLFGTYIPAFSVEVHMGNGPIYFDLTHFTPEKVQLMRRTLPTLLKMYERVGVVNGDQFVTKIEWMTCAPRCEGGPLPNRKMETCLPGLYSVGDATAQAGLEGGKGFLAWAMTSGAVAGRNATAFAKTVEEVKIDMGQVEASKTTVLAPLKRRNGIEPEQVALETLDAVVPYTVLTITSEENLKQALKKVEAIRDTEVPLLIAYDPHYARMAFEARNMVLMAEIQLRSVLLREESRRAMTVIREDFPYTDNINWLKYVSAKQVNGRMHVYTQDMPFDKWKVKPPREKYLAPMWQALQDRGKVKIKGGKVIWV